MPFIPKIDIRMEGKIFKGGSERVIGRHLTAGMTEIAAFGEREIKKNTPIGASGGRGGLVGSVFGDVRRGGRKPLAVFGSSSLHALPVEEGTRPHFPPVDALVDWVRFKGLDVRAGIPPRRMAFLVARKISQRGTKGQKMFAKSIPKIRRFAERQIGLKARAITEEFK